MGGARDAGGADPVAVGDGGQPLHVAAEHAADGLGLGLAQLGELVGDVRDRAVLLAQLLAHRARRATPAAYPSSVRTRASTSAGLELRVRPSLTTPKRSSMNATRRGREFPDRGVAAGLVEEAQRLHGEVVVLLVEARRGRPRSARTPWPGGRGPRAPWLRGSRASTVPSSSSWSRWRRTAAGVRSSRCGERGRGGGAVDQDRPDDALARRLVVPPAGAAVSLQFHNTSVPLMLRAVQVRHPLPARERAPAP